MASRIMALATVAKVYTQCLWLIVWGFQIATGPSLAPHYLWKFGTARRLKCCLMHSQIDPKCN